MPVKRHNLDGYGAPQIEWQRVHSHFRRATNPFDLVVEGRAERVSDPAELTTVANTFNAQGWPARVERDALVAEYSAQSAGPPPWHVYRVTPATLYAFGTAEPYGAARFEVS